ncbi:MAG TPA: hypothetical protein VLH18_02560 [Candidatus Limnocylindrales bacterium]|nr:hypothetical protein [Candidatus Limnocylindrales bacterium]
MTIAYQKETLTGTVKDTLPLDLKLARQNKMGPLWNELVRQYHYLVHGKRPGVNLK